MASGAPKRIGIYPGSFDPMTLGHCDILHRATHLFDKIIILIAMNSSKKGLFSFEERRDMLFELTKDQPFVEVDSLKDGLMVDYCREKKATAIIRGLRAVGDFEYEYAVTLMNRRIAPEIETIFFMTSDKYSFISSTIVKEVARLGGDVKGVVPPLVADRLQEKFRNG